MKKTLAIIAASTLSIQIANAATIYNGEDGRVDITGKVQYEAGALKYDKQDKTQRLNFGGDGTARLGTWFRYHLSEDIDLLGKLEWQFNAEDENDAKTDSLDVRYAWLGFSYRDQFEMALGRTKSPTSQLVDVTDIFELFGSAANGNRINGIKSFESKKDDQLTLGLNYDRWGLRASYVFEDERRPRETVSGHRDYQYSFSARYRADMGVDLVTAYERQSFQGTTPLLGDLTSWGLGVGYQHNSLYLGAIGGHKSMQAGNNEEFSSNFYELASAYQLGEFLVMAGYNKEKGEDNLASEGTRVDEYVFGVSYQLMPRAKIYAEYNIDRIKLDNRSRDDLYGVGVELKF
ncbi:MAG: porin [Halomonas sp.]|nr:porin [Halomonas sp.]MCC5903797.1 porin [Halomonas sp.]